MVCQRPANVHHIRPVGLGIGYEIEATTKQYLFAENIIKDNSVFTNCKEQFEAKNYYGTEHEMNY